MVRKKYLVIQHKMIGDVLASTVICEYLKKIDTNCEVHMLANNNTIDVLLNNPYIDKIIPYKPVHSSVVKTFLKFIRSIRQQKYNVVIDVYCKTRSNVLSLLSDAPERISFYKWYSQFFYTKTIKRRTSSQTIASYAIENRMLLVNNNKEINEQVLRPKIFLKDSEIQQAKSILEKYNLFETPPIMLSIIGSSEKRSYPTRYMAKIIDYLCEITTDVFILNYIPSQLSQVESILDLVSDVAKQRIHMKSYGHSIREFLSLLYWCKAIIGNEGGATNMAKAINVPTFSINSPWIDKDGWNMFEDGVTHTSIHLQDYKPKLFANKTPKQLKNSAIELYENFTPELIYDQLKSFCDTHLLTNSFEESIKKELA